MEPLKESLGLKLILAGVFCAVLGYSGIIVHPLVMLGMVGFTFSGIIVYAIEQNAKKR
jgi:hypothetical protein